MNKETISKVIKSLPQADREQLKLAHQYGVAQYIKLKDGHFVGVHLNGVPGIKVEITHNDWYFGTLLFG